MAPKSNCNPTKLNNIVHWMQRSRTVWNIKDLEKQLPSVASINGMQVKDYLQSLSDDNKIHVEKIGSGNWYWSFASESLKVHQQALTDAQAAHAKQASTNDTLKRQIEEARVGRCKDEEEEEKEGEGIGGPSGESREELDRAKAELETIIMSLNREIDAYKDNDPTEVERKREETGMLKVEAETATDDIYLIESYFVNKLGLDREGLQGLRKTYYGDELDEEEGVLKEFV